MLIRTLTLASLLLGMIVPPPPAPQPLQSEPPQKTFDITPYSSGDCRLISGTVTIYPNGTGVFHATTLTYHTHSGDYWHIRLFGRSAGETNLFETGTFTGPRMNDGNPPPPYNWEDRFTFDRSVYGTIERLHTESKC